MVALEIGLYFQKNWLARPSTSHFYKKVRFLTFQDLSIIGENSRFWTAISEAAMRISALLLHRQRNRSFIHNRDLLELTRAGKTNAPVPGESSRAGALCGILGGRERPGEPGREAGKWPEGRRSRRIPWGNYHRPFAVTSHQSCFGGITG